MFSVLLVFVMAIGLLPLASFEASANSARVIETRNHRHKIAHERSLDWYVTNRSSTTYCPDLSVMAAAFADAAYREDLIKKSLVNHGFNDAITRNYGSLSQTLQFARPAVAIGTKTVNGRRVVAIVIRGTGLEPVSPRDIATNLVLGDKYAGNDRVHSGFHTSTDAIIKILEDNNLLGSNNTYFVTGHSLGGAVANLLARRLMTGQSILQSRVFAYTFASPETARVTTTVARASQYNNIFNIVNTPDPITVAVAAFGFTGWVRYGRDIFIHSEHAIGQLAAHPIAVYLDWMWWRSTPSTSNGVSRITSSATFYTNTFTRFYRQPSGSSDVIDTVNGSRFVNVNGHRINANGDMWYSVQNAHGHSGGTWVPSENLTQRHPETTRTVTFNPNNGSTSSTRSVRYNTAVGSLPTPTRQGHRFDGWFAGPTTGARITAETRVIDHVTYHARWTPTATASTSTSTAASSRTVTFNVNGGNALSPSTRTVANNATVGTLPTPTRANNAFNGWFTAQTGGTRIDANTRVTANVTYWARWTAITTMTAETFYTTKNDVPVRLNPFDTDPITRYLAQNTPVTINARTTNSSGNVWYRTSSGTWIFSGNLAGGRTVTFNANGGSVSQTTRSVANGGAVGALPMPATRTTHAFNGWFTAQTGGSRIDANTRINSNVTYWARWTTVTSMTATTFYANKNDVPVRRNPFDTDPITSRLSRNTAVTVNGKTTNSSGNVWYRTTNNTWIFSGNLSTSRS